jgi:hypothetical protein
MRLIKPLASVWKAETQGLACIQLPQSSAQQAQVVQQRKVTQAGLNIM